MTERQIDRPNVGQIKSRKTENIQSNMVSEKLHIKE